MFSAGLISCVVSLFVSLWGGVEWSGTETTTGLLYQSRMMDDDECGAVGRMIGKGNRSTSRKPTLVPLCPSQIPHNVTRARTWAAVFGS
jgi:hypothetical protein